MSKPLQQRLLMTLSAAMGSFGTCLAAAEQTWRLSSILNLHQAQQLELADAIDC